MVHICLELLFEVFLVGSWLEVLPSFWQGLMRETQNSVKLQVRCT